MPPPLRSWIEAAVKNALTHEQLNALVGVCHALASVALRRKIAPVMLASGVHGMNYADLAYDCIGELFEQGEDGSLLQIRAYFEGIDLDGASDQALLAHLRRMVFTKVNHGVVRFYSEADPDLGKILRNIRLSVQALHNFTVVERFGDASLAPANCPTLENLPPFSREELEAALREEVSPDDHVPAMLARLSRILRDQNARARIVSLTAVALAIRGIYCAPESAPPDGVTVEDVFTVPDVLALVRSACAEVIARMTAEYVDSGKVEIGLFRTYADIVEKNVALRLTGEDRDGASLFSGMRAAVPTLSEAEYRAKHRARLEYIARLAYKRSVEMLRANA